jgi:hypothetical protein
METNKQLTLRQLISLVRNTPGWEEKMFQHLFKRDQRVFSTGKKIDIEQTRGAYSHVLNELLDKPKAKSFKYPICVKTTVDPFDKRKFTDVCLINPNYEAPAPGLKPWGGNPPEGHYNLNLNKHNQWFAFGWTTWSKLIDTTVLIQTEKPLPLWQVLGYILWDLTFDGWTEKLTEKNHKVLEKQLAKSMKQIKEGKCTRIAKKEGDSFSVVIPDCVKKQIKDIVTKYENKNKKSKV